HELRSGIFYNRGEAAFDNTFLPIESQFTPLHDFLLHDLNGDRLPDAVGVGNFHEANIQRGRYDAGYGELLINEGEGTLRQVSNRAVNWFLEGQIRKVELIEIGGEEVMITAENNGPLRFFRISNRAW